MSDVITAALINAGVKLLEKLFDYATAKRATNDNSKSSQVGAVGEKEVSNQVGPQTPGQGPTEF
jgi:hypothetical protein